MVTADDYARARRFMSPHVERLVRNIDVVPHWIGTDDAFWYLRETRDGHEFVRVDIGERLTRPLFDHDKVAANLTALIGRDVFAQTLPSADGVVDDDGSALTVTVDERRLRVDLDTSDVTDLGPVPRPDHCDSPDGRWSMRVDAGNLVLIDTASGAERTVTTDGEPDHGYAVTPDGWQADYVKRWRAGATAPFDVHWSPDSRRAVVPRIDQRHVAPYPLIESAPHEGGFRPRVHLPRLPLVGERPPTVEYHLLDATTGTLTRIALPYDDLLDVQQDLLPVRRWWYVADRLFALAFGTDMTAAYLFEIDVASGAVRVGIEERDEPRVDLNSTTYNPPNVRLLDGGNRAVWFSQRDGWGHLYLYDTASGEMLRQLTSGPWLVRDILHVDERRGRLVVSGSGREPGDPYLRYVYRVGIDTDDNVLLSPEPVDRLVAAPDNDVLMVEGGRGHECVSPSGNYLVYTTSPLDAAGETLVRSVDDGAPVMTVDHADITDLLEAGWRSPEPFVVKAADETTDVHGVIYWPPDVDRSRRYPVLDCQYGSPLTAVVPHNLDRAIRGPSAPAPAAMAQLGFIVVVVDARGTTFRDRAFSMANHGRLHLNGMDDHVAAIRQLADRYGCLDLDRVGVYGRSYGGWTALRAMLEFPDFFRAGSAAAPIGTFFGHYLDYHQYTYQGRPRYADGTDLRPSPDAIPDNWAVLDSVAQAKRLTGKLQIIVGEIDENVLAGSILQFVQALARADKDVDLIYLPGTDHFFRQDMYVARRITDFFVRHLLGEEPPS